MIWKRNEERKCFAGHHTENFKIDIVHVKCTLEGFSFAANWIHHVCVCVYVTQLNEMLISYSGDDS